MAKKFLPIIMFTGGLLCNLTYAVGQGDDTQQCTTACVESSNQCVPACQMVSLFDTDECNKFCSSHSGVCLDGCLDAVGYRHRLEEARAAAAGMARRARRAREAQ